MLRFPDDEVCYLFPLGKNQSMPEKLMRDIEKAKRVRTQIILATVQGIVFISMYSPIGKYFYQCGT